MGKLVGCEYMGGGGGWGQEGTILIPIAIAGLISTLIRGKMRLVLSLYKRGARQYCSSSKGTRYCGRLISNRPPYKQCHPFSCIMVK